MESTTKTIAPFRARFDGICSRCNEPFKGWQTNGWDKNDDRCPEISWARSARQDGLKGVAWHTRCADLSENADYLAKRLADKTEKGEVIPTESKPITQTIPTENKPVSTVSAAASNDVFASMASAMLPYLEGKIKVSASELTAELEAKIQAAVNGATKVITIDNKRTGETKDVGRQHEHFEKLLTLIASGHNVYLMGAPGSGKSTAANKVAEALSLRYGYISLSAQTAESRILGFMNATGVYVETEFYRCYKDGGVFCIDEMDNASANLLTALNSALENGRAAFPCGVVDQHKDFVLVATGNTAGYGANPMFPERRPMDAAFRERFVFLSWEYDESLERDLALGVNDKAAKWIDWVQKTRGYAKTHFPKLLVTPRASIKGAGLVRDFKPDMVADMVIFKGFDADSKARILAANPLPRL
jgi:energy-coupling factor transporter ATP-binding protein EcfA2